jgi:hypothetical protein
LALWLRPSPAALTRRELADLYCRGGDTFARMYFIAEAEGMSEPTEQALLSLGRRYYRLGGAADPTSARAVLSLGLASRAMGRVREGNSTMFRALREGLLPPGQAAAVRALLVLRRPDLESVEVSRQALGDAGLSPVLFADVYQRMGRADLANRETRAAEQRGLSLLPALIVLLVTCGLLLTSGVALLVYGAVSLVRRSSRGRAAPGPLPAAWGPREALEAVVILLLVQLFAGYVGRRALGEGVVPRASVQAVAAILSGICALVWVKLVSAGAEFGWRFARWARQTVIGIGVAGLALPALVGLEQLLTWLLAGRPAQDPVNMLLATPPSWSSRAAIVLFICVVVPVLEETLFRGVLYRALRRERAFPPAALGSALVFAAGHLTAATFPPMLILGILLAYLYERSGSLLTPAVAHGVYNAVNLALMLAIFG